MKRYDYQ